MKTMLGDLLRRAVSRPVSMPQKAEMEATDAKAFTVRPTAELRVYLEKRAEQLGDLPLSNLVVMILSAFKDAETQGEYSDYGHYDDTARRTAERIRHLYSAYGYTLMDAVRTLEEYGITPAIFLDDTLLVDKLNGAAYAELSEAFCVREEWLTNPLYDNQMSERPTNRHNSYAILAEILKHENDGILERVIPICNSRDLVGNQLNYSGEHDKVYTSIAIKLKPHPKYKHARVKAWSEIPFDYVNARIEFKALLLRLYEQYADSAIFQGQALAPKTYERVLAGRDVVPAKVVDGLRTPWDAEFYVGATWGDHPPLDQEELPSVREFADQYLKLSETQTSA